MLLFTTFILVFALSSGEVSEEDLGKCLNNFFDFHKDIQGNLHLSTAVALALLSQTLNYTVRNQEKPYL